MYDLNKFKMLSLKKPSCTLYLTIEELTSPSLESRAYKNFDEGKTTIPPRPLNSFMIFRKNFQAGVNIHVKDTAKKVQESWNEVSSEVRCFFELLSKMAREKHLEKFPDYKYSPKKTSKNSIK